LLHAERERQTPVGASLRRTAKVGRRPDDDAVLAVMRRWFWTVPSDRGFSLFGFPENRRQALVLDEWLETRAESLDACLAFKGIDSADGSVAAHYRDQGLLVELNQSLPSGA